MPRANIVSRLASVLLVFALIVAVVLVIGPRTGAYRTLTVLSGSMEPRFGAGDMVIATPAPTSSVRVGDVITYEAPITGRPVVTHRVERVLSPGRHPVVVTRGDANASADPWRARLTGDTIWRQRFVIPGAGRVIRLLRHDALITMTTYGLPVLLAVLVLIDIWKPARSRRAELEAEDAEQGWDWLDDLDLSIEDEHPYEHELELEWDLVLTRDARPVA